MPLNFLLLEIIGNLVTFQHGYWFRPGWFDYKILVRCDDPGNKCPCGINSPTVAYSSQRNPRPPYQKARINFCPRYFAQDTLDVAMEKGKGSLGLPIEYANMDRYHKHQGEIEHAVRLFGLHSSNKFTAYTWIHELLHNDDVSKAKDNPATKHIVDFWIKYGTIAVKAYGPERSKGVARWATEFQHTSLTHRNVDNIGLYIMARYVQEKVLDNVYPHLPLAPRPPDAISKTPIAFADLATYYSNGTTTALGATAEDQDCGDGDDVDEGVTPEVSPTYSGFITRDKYPASYLAQYDAWASP